MPEAAEVLSQAAQPPPLWSVLSRRLFYHKTIPQSDLVNYSVAGIVSTASNRSGLASAYDTASPDAQPITPKKETDSCKRRVPNEQQSR